MSERVCVCVCVGGGGGGGVPAVERVDAYACVGNTCENNCISKCAI